MWRLEIVEALEKVPENLHFSQLKTVVAVYCSTFFCHSQKRFSNVRAWPLTAKCEQEGILYFYKDFSTKVKLTFCLRDNFRRFVLADKIIHFLEEHFVR